MAQERFRLIRLLGAGGVAEVWLAFDRRRREQVAVKRLRPHYAADDTILRRLRREADLITALDSPYIVKVYGIVEGDPAPMVAMEYVAGADLRTLLALEGKMEAIHALRLLRQIAAGVAVAHRANVVHRDLKPANILMTPDGTPKITDFGIAHASAGAQLTEPNQMWGTSHYLAPEQALGQPITPATDVYSLGVMLFEMLTGRVPFDGDDPVQVALAHIQQPPPSVHTFNPLIPMGIEQLVFRLLAKSPAERPANGEALVAILDRYLDSGDQQTLVRDATLVAPAPPVPPPFQRPPRPAPKARRWGWLWLVGAVILLLGVGGIVAALNNPTAAAPTTDVIPGKGIAVVVPTLTPTATATPTRTPTPLPTRREGNGADAVALSVAESNRPVTVDGALGEWGAVPMVAVNQVTSGAAQWTGQADVSGSAAFAWDATYLYLAIERRDDVHIQTTTGELLAEGDVVELWLDVAVGEDYDVAEPNEDDYQIIFSAGDFATRRAEVDVPYPAPRSAERTRRILVRAVPLPNGYTLEGAIPWEILGITPRPTLTLGYAVVLNDTDSLTTGDPSSQVSTTPQSPFRAPRTFGNLTLQ